MSEQTDQFWLYLVITLLSVALMYGVFQGSTKTTLKSLKESMTLMSAQVTEIRNDQKMIQELNVKVYGVELKIESLEKCQDHTTKDLDAVQVRLNKLRADK